jgi:two-component system sensor histidine kinase PilS (NtrC family)
MGVEQDLDLKLKRLMLLRVVMVTTLLLIAVYVETASETLLQVNPLYFLIAGTYALTLIHVLALRLVKSGEALVMTQVVGDLLIISGLVYVTGGTRAGFILLYPISVLSGSVLLVRRRGLALAGLATVFYGTLLWGVRSSLLPPQGLADVPTLPAKHLLYSIFVTGVACATVATIGAFLAESLRSAGARLEEAAVAVADLRELNNVIVDSIHSGLVLADFLGHVVYVNAVGEAILGVRAAEVRGRPIRQVFSSWLLDAPALQVRAANRGLARLDVAYLRPDGEQSSLGVSVSPLAKGATADGGFLLVFQDLTEVKRLEEEVRTKEKLAAVGEMAALLAHEIRNPLGSISGSAQVLLAEPNLSDEQGRLLEIITRESRRLSDALNQFLFQARPSPALPGPVDLTPVIEEAIILLRNGPEVGPSHRVEFEAQAGPHLCLADRDQIAQVFWNLARNALEAMPGGGVLRVRLRHTDDEVILAVRDEGHGMPAEEQGRLFEPFESRSPMGTGLGLAIVYRIVRDHRGDISVRSVPAQGTEVEVRLPLVPVPVVV